MAGPWEDFQPAASGPWEDFSPPPSAGGGPQTGRKYVSDAMRQDRARDKMYRDSMAYATGAAKANPVAVADAALNIGRQAVAAPIAGLAGAVTAPAGFIPGMQGVGARNVERAQSFIGGQPMTEGGQQLTEAITYPFQKLAQGADWLGQKASDATGSPLIGTVVNTATQAAPALLGRARVNRGNGSPDSVGRPVATRAPEARPAPAAQAQRPARLERVSEAAPSIDELAAAKNAAYKAAEETGVVISRQGMNRLKVDIVNDLKKEGIDKDLHPAASAAVRRIVETKGQLTLSQLETLRKIANDARTSNNPADARLGSRIIEKIDDFEETLGDADVVSGSPAAATAFKEARALNQRVAKARTIQKLFDDAELAVGANYTVAGMDTALRQQFRALAKNDKKLRGFTAEEKAAIRKVALGGPLQNSMRVLGKFAPDNLLSFIASLGAYGAAGPVALALPAAGYAAKSGAARMGVNNANRVSQMVRGNPLPQAAPRNQLATVE